MYRILWIYFEYIYYIEMEVKGIDVSFTFAAKFKWLHYVKWSPDCLQDYNDQQS